jgi:DUF4097 and DUF4098 domain-containing protein YvlB
LLALALSPACHFDFDDRSVSESEEHTIALDPQGRFQIENPRGLIRVETWDRPEVRIEADKYAGTREALEEVRVEITGEGDHVEVKTHTRDGFGLWGGSGGSVDYRISLPATVRLEASTVNGQVEVDGVSGDIEISSVNGQVTATDTQGEVRASTINGKVEVRHASLPERAHHEYSCINGTVRIYLPGSAAGRFHVEWVNGTVDSDFPMEFGRSWPGPREVDTQLGEGGSHFKLSTVNGTIKILKRQDEVRSTAKNSNSM